MLKKLLLIIGLCLLVTPAFAQSLDTCDQLIQRSPDDTGVQLYYDRSVTHYADEDYQDAVDMLTKGLSLVEFEPELYLHRACHYAGLEDYESAYSDLLTYVDMTHDEVDTLVDTTESFEEAEDAVEVEAVEEVELLEITTDVALPQSITMDMSDFGGNVTVNYPEGWVARDEASAIVIASSEDALEINDPATLEDLPEGTVVISITVIPADMAGLMGIEGEITPASIVETFTSFIEDSAMPEFSEVEEVQLNGDLAARSSGTTEILSAVLYAVEKDGDFTFAFGSTRADEYDVYAEEIEAIISSTEFTPLEQ